MITLLLALHPSCWRARYGEEFRALLEAQPLTAMVVLNVIGNAGRQQARTHRILLRLALAVTASVAVEWVAVTGRFTDNILWSPDTGSRAALLALLLLPWLPLGFVLLQAAQRRRRHRLEAP